MSEQGNNIQVAQDGDGVTVTVHQVTPSGVQRASIRLSADQADGIGGVFRYAAASVRGEASVAEEPENDEKTDGSDDVSLVPDPNDREA